MQHIQREIERSDTDVRAETLALAVPKDSLERARTCDSFGKKDHFPYYSEFRSVELPRRRGRLTPLRSGLTVRLTAVRACAARVRDVPPSRGPPGRPWSAWLRSDGPLPDARARGGPAARPRRTADDHHRTGSGPSGLRAGRGQTTPGLWPRTGSKAGRGSAQPQVLTLSTCCCLDPHRDTRSHFQHVGAPYQWRSQPAGLHVAHMDMHHAHHYRTLVLWASHCIFIFPRVCRLTTVCHTILSSPVTAVTAACPRVRSAEALYRAHLSRRLGQAAAAEAQRLLDHRFGLFEPSSCLYADVPAATTIAAIAVAAAAAAAAAAKHA